MSSRPAVSTFHGKPCRTCGATERYSRNTACVACSRVRGRKQVRRQHTYNVSLEFIKWVTT